MADSGNRHLRTDSQAVQELENVFKSVDLEGNGKLDMASFQTAMYSLDVRVEDEKMEELFYSVDTTRKGYIQYDEFLNLLKMGRLNKTAQEVIDYAKSAPSIISSSSVVPKMKLDPKRKKTIHRAIIVIKKAAMKNITREEVVEFLRDKGINDEDINYAYEKALEQAMSPEERISYLKAQIFAKDEELSAQDQFTRHMLDEAQRKTAEIKVLRAACMQAAGQLLEKTLKDDAKTDAPEEVLNEVSENITKIQLNIQNLDGESGQRLASHLKKLKKLDACLKTGRGFCSYLVLLSLDPDIKNSMHRTRVLLSVWEQ